MSILPRLPACAVSASPEPSVYKCGKCLRNPDWQVMFDHEPEKAVATRRRGRDQPAQLNWRRVIEHVMCAEIND